MTRFSSGTMDLPLSVLRYAPMTALMFERCFKRVPTWCSHPTARDPRCARAGRPGWTSATAIDAVVQKIPGWAAAIEACVRRQAVRASAKAGDPLDPNGLVLSDRQFSRDIRLDRR